MGNQLAYQMRVHSMNGRSRHLFLEWGVMYMSLNNCWMVNSGSMCLAGGTIPATVKHFVHF